MICLGHVLDAEGKKMSKSLGNIVKPMEMIDKYGADAVRWYMYHQPTGRSKRFDEKSLQDMVRKNFTILVNVAEFYKMFATDNGSVTKSTHVLDRWILARLNKLVAETTSRLESYVITETVRDLGAFIDDLSTWYVRRSRDRFKSTTNFPSRFSGVPDGAEAPVNSDKSAAVATLRESLLTLSKLMAPFAPFLAETLYKQVGGNLESVSPRRLASRRPGAHRREGPGGNGTHTIHRLQGARASIRCWHQCAAGVERHDGNRSNGGVCSRVSNSQKTR